MQYTRLIVEKVNNTYLSKNVQKYETKIEKIEVIWRFIAG
jgi:hypothetical protein